MDEPCTEHRRRFFRKKPTIAQRPDTFDNTMDATDWLNRMERYFHSLGVNLAADKAETLLENMAYTERLKFENLGARKDADRYENLRQTMVRAHGPPRQSNSTLKTKSYSRKQQPRRNRDQLLPATPNARRQDPHK
jgi:hypothetical protein